MYCRAIVCDLDGTGANNGALMPEVAAALGAARAQGIKTILATGRVVEDIRGLCPDLSLFDAIVAENGAVVITPAQTIQIGAAPPQEFLAALHANGIPFHVGAVVVGTWDKYSTEVLRLVREHGLDLSMVFNRAALMLLPSGVTKGTGVQRALAELGRSPYNTVAFGDAENDLSVFRMVGLSVAVRGSAPAIAAQSDVHLSRPGGEGLAQHIHAILAQKGVVPAPERHCIILGHTDGGDPAILPSLGTNVLISGDPRSGKSWLTGLLVEQLIAQDLRFCLIDPEGGNLALAESVGVCAFGSGLIVPPPTQLPNLLRKSSVVLNLSSLLPSEQSSYVDALLPVLAMDCRASGLPQWIVIDEAQYFFHGPSAILSAFGSSGSLALVTYRPSLIHSAVHDLMTSHLILPTTVEEERYLITALFQACGPRDAVAADATRSVTQGNVGLLTKAAPHPRWQVFTPGARRSRHTHHARKYVDQRLPAAKAFRFLMDDSALVAHDVGEFYRAIKTVPTGTLRHHLVCGDFSRWIAEVLGDEPLARGVHKLEIAARGGATIDRTEIGAYLADYYQIEPAADVPEQS